MIWQDRIILLGVGTLIWIIGAVVSGEDHLGQWSIGYFVGVAWGAVIAIVVSNGGF